MKDIKGIQKLLLEFRKTRNWEQFHNLKDLAISLSLEASELLELFQWKDNKEVELFNKSEAGKARIAEELADIFNWVLLIAYDANINIIDAADKKIKQNSKKYPLDKSRGNHKKYTEHDI